MKKIVYLFAFFLLLASCQKDEVIQQEEPVTPSPSQEASLKVVPGHIRIKLKSGTPTPTVVKTRSGELSTGVTNLDLSSLNIRAYRMERVFHGKYENLLRQSGLDRWYDIYFDETVPTRSAVTEYTAIPEIEKVEQVYEAKTIGATRIPEYLIPVMEISRIAAAARRVITRSDGQPVETYPFNDPDLPKQWHYHNDGTFLDGSIPGADINLFQAWKIETGSPNVIVAVMDGGIQVTHSDLQANLWTNTGEIPGNGIDDDNNGYIDDIHGFNFVTAKKAEDGTYSNGTLSDYEHGTHCAGTISAVNGNKIGVSGIAGGSGKGDGVRLMSCQIFHMEGDKSKGTTDPNIFVYAADNGAVISQNSWTGGVPQDDEGFLNSAMKEAIDYFINYAGCGADGQQLANSPMKGGMVIFAAANDNTDVKAYPAAYERNLRVASMGPMFEKAVYSNYGDWVDLTAPGGEQNLGERYGILSTTINNGYSWLQGTSMACPHVSGCAALILSKFQGPGYTADDLRDRIMNTLQDIDQYNPKFAGKMGKGYIDVGAALTPATEEPPVTTLLKLIDSYDDWAILEWNVQTAADGPINKYELYWSEKPIAGDPDNIPQKKVFDVRFLKEGELIRDTVKRLSQGETYYYTLRGIDRWGNISDYAPEVSAEVKVNQAPRISPQWEGTVIMDEGDTRTLSFEFQEPENQSVNVTMTPDYNWVSTQISDNELQLILAPDFGNAGNYNLTLKVEDQYGKSVSRQVAFQVNGKVVAPVILSPVNDMTLQVLNKEQLLNLNNIFSDPNHGKLIFEVTNSDNNVAWVQRKENNLVITGKQNGSTHVQVRAINEYNLSTSIGFTIYVQGSSSSTETWTTYPDAITDNLTITLNSALQGNAQIRIYNAAGKQVISKEVVIGQTGYVVDMSALARGVYVLTLEVQGQKFTKNIVKI